MFLCQSIKLGEPAHARVTKTVHKTLQGGSGTGDVQGMLGVKVLWIVGFGV